MKRLAILIPIGLAALLLSLPAQAATAVITLTPNTGLPETSVLITGSGFPPDEIVALYIDSPGPYLDVPGPRADAQGAFTQRIKWPTKIYDRSGKIDPTSGTHSVCGDTGYPGSNQPIAVKACAQFVVRRTASPSASPTPVDAGSGPGVPLPVVGGVLLILAGLGAAMWWSTRSRS